MRKRYYLRVVCFSFSKKCRFPLLHLLFAAAQLIVGRLIELGKLFRVDIIEKERIFAAKLRIGTLFEVFSIRDDCRVLRESKKANLLLQIGLFDFVRRCFRHFAHKTNETRLSVRSQVFGAIRHKSIKVKLYFQAKKEEIRNKMVITINRNNNNKKMFFF